ncbi:ATP-binding protein [Arthrobacter crystallopoietes]|uniref:ATP-binding protein n=1 Tax=Crystallibacter crystallopoietes TaxID=37928 RepID=UPI003D1CD2C8
MARDVTSPSGGLLDYEDFFNHAPVGHMVAAPDGTILALNDTIESWTGIPRERLVGTPCCRCFPKEDYDRFMTSLTTTGQARGIVELLGQPWRPRPVVLSAVRREGKDGRPELDHIVLSEAISDLGTDRQGKPLQTGVPAIEVGSAEQEFRRNEALLQAVLDTVGVGVAVIDAEGQPLLQNRAFSAIVRHASPGNTVEAEEADLLVFGPDGITPIPPERRFLPRLSEGESFSEELIWIGGEKDRRALSVTGRSTRNDAFEGSVIAFDDITQLATALTAKNQFVETISHELRTPLTSIMGYLHLALDENLPPHLRRSLETAMRNSERLLQLVTDLLSVASGTGEPEKQDADVSEMITSRIRAVAPRAEARHIRIVQDCPERLPAFIDPQGMARVLDNLLSNAVKFSHPGAQVTVQAFRTGQNIIVRVIDTGIGMSEDEQREIFDTFFRSSRAIKAAIPGAGLGLSISKAIIEAQHGTMTVTSSPGQGSTVTVILPDNNTAERR